MSKVDIVILILWRRKWRSSHQRGSHPRSQDGKWDSHSPLSGFTLGPFPFPVCCFYSGVSILASSFSFCSFLALGMRHLSIFQNYRFWRRVFFWLVAFRMMWFIFICLSIHFFTHTYLSPFTCGQMTKIWRYINPHYSWILCLGICLLAKKSSG